MKTTHIISMALLLLFWGCSTAENTVGGANEQESGSDQGAGLDLDAVSSGIDQIFSGSPMEQSALHAEGHEEGEADFNIDPCEIMEETGDIGFTREVVAGHYGRPSAGMTIEADLTCDSSSQETSWLSWVFAEVRHMECTGRSLSFEGGSGIVRFSYGENTVTEIYGSFTVNGDQIYCDFSFGSLVDGDGDLNIACEDASGNSVEEGSDEVTCE